MRRKLLSWTIIPIMLLGMMTLVHFLNRPAMQRLGMARQELSLAGYPDAQVNKTQLPGNMARCDVSQVRANRGYVYGWETDTHAGVFCFPMDGRPRRILLN